MTGYDFKRYEYKENISFIRDALETVPSLVETSTYRNVEYVELPFSFDIETSSWYNLNNEKRGCMYCWQVGLNGRWLLGRTWKEFHDFINNLITILNLNLDRRIICWVHNLKYEFQFLQYKFTWNDIFAIDALTPVQAVADCGIEFRCSYIQSGKSLAKLGEDLTKYKLPKLVGDLDYKKLRHWKTHLTDKEMEYCRNDVLILNGYIQELKDKGENISNILLTKTMYVRRDVRNRCFYGDGKHKRNTKEAKKYKQLMKALTLEPDEYESVHAAFAGGFNHANARNANKTLLDVTSWDFTSSYPAVMLTEMFPMSKGEKIEGYYFIDDFPFKSNCLYVFTVRFKNIKVKEDAPDTPISFSKCSKISKYYELDNGRVWKADELETTITNIDLDTIRAFYDFDECVIFNAWEYIKSYLPLPIIQSVIKYYKNKTTLKDVQGEEEAYQLFKGFLNSIYGMMVSNILHDNFTWGEMYGWTSEKLTDLKDELDKYNNSSQRFLSYVWGVFITAYARRNLFSGILACGEDYIYSDTDSIKILNSDEHKDYIEAYNNMVIKKLKAMCNTYKIDFSEVSPYTIENEQKIIGLWDFDGHYKKFKTLGAKRYMVLTYKDELKITIAGVNKKTGASYLKTLKDPFKSFTDNLVIPKEYSGKKTLTYSNDSYTEEVTDYNGITAVVSESTWSHMESVDFSLNMTDSYMELITYVQQKER